MTSDPPTKWNPRYVCYARSHGKTPEEMREHDRDQWPGGAAVGFILWSNQKLREWCDLKGYRLTACGHNDTILLDADWQEYDRWLDETTRVKETP